MRRARGPSSAVRSLLLLRLRSLSSPSLRPSLPPLPPPSGAAASSPRIRSFSSRLLSSSLPLLHRQVRFSLTGADLVRRLSSSSLQQQEQEQQQDEAALEEEAQKKAGWLLKSIFILTATFAAFQFFPYMGDNLLQQSISLLRVRDPLFKRMGASRLARYAVDGMQI